MIDLQNLLEAANKATQNPELWKWHTTGLIPERMAALPIIGSHNRTPYISYENAKYLQEANPATIKALVTALQEAIVCLKKYNQWDRQFGNEPRRAAEALKRIEELLG